MTSLKWGLANDHFSCTTAFFVFFPLFLENDEQLLYFKTSGAKSDLLLLSLSLIHTYQIYSQYKCIIWYIDLYIISLEFQKMKCGIMILVLFSGKRIENLWSLFLV